MIVVNVIFLLFDLLRNRRNDYGIVMINGQFFSGSWKMSFKISILIPEKELALLIVLLKFELGYTLFFISNAFFQLSLSVA